MKKNNKIVLSLSAALILANSLHAKEPTSLDAITVTAQKTEENIQDVPISMTVFNEFTIEDKMMDDVSDIAKYTPGLEILGSGSALKSYPSIRGIQGNYANRNSSAGLFVDGIPITDGTGFDESLMDIERIEVLKGPQGTLYGKNTEVGAVIIITKKPNNETRGKVKATFGSDNKKELAFSASGPIVKDKFYIGIAGKHSEKDGFVQNTNTNKIADDREHNYGKLNLRWTPSDDLELSLISSKKKYKYGANRSGLVKDKYHEVTSDFDSLNTTGVTLNALNISYSINDKLNFTSITTHRKIDDKHSDDWDYSNNDAEKYHVLVDSTSKTLSQELKLNYENKNIKLVSGIFVEKGDVHSDKDTDAYWMAQIKTSIADIKNDSIGLFSHITYDINEKLSILGGLRYDKVEQEYKDATQTIENSENEISPKIGLSYDLEENMMTYATISKGYRSGGFNSKAPAGFSKTFDKETLYSYEVGLKGTSLDNRLTYDIALYHMDITDMQVGVYINAYQSIRKNAAKATSQGVEASLNFQATDTLNLFTGFSYNNISFDKYHDGKTDFNGKRIAYSPKYDFNIGALYRADNEYYASADISGYGDMYLDNKNDYKRDAYALVNAKIGYETDKYDVYLYAKNLFDKEYDKNGVYSGIYNFYSDPSEIGVQLAYRF